LLAAIGLYAVLSYMVVQRRAELGLRIALGAQRGQILRLILNRGLLLAVIGLACGLAASAALTRFVSGMLYGIHALDPVTYLITTAVLLAVACISGFAPAWRASVLDPNETLRDQ
jgi:putative ABC transport system permease protein